MNHTTSEPPNSPPRVPESWWLLCVAWLARCATLRLRHHRCNFCTYANNFLVRRISTNEVAMERGIEHDEIIIGTASCRAARICELPTFRREFYCVRNSDDRRRDWVVFGKVKIYRIMYYRTIDALLQPYKVLSWTPNCNWHTNTFDGNGI